MCSAILKTINCAYREDHLKRQRIEQLRIHQLSSIFAVPVGMRYDIIVHIVII